MSLLPVTAVGVRLPRPVVVLVAGLCSIALVFSTEVPQAKAEPLVPAAPVVPGEAPAEVPDSDGDGTPDRPDLVSAGVTARLLGVAVEDLSQRSETVRVLVNPDGTLDQEAHSAPVWVRDADGEWVDVDYTLVPRDGGGFAPKASPSSVVIDGGGAREFARLDLPGGGSTVWSWPEVLPAPVIEGATATYAVADGVDLLVIATAVGVSTRILINAPEAVVPEFTVQVRTEGVDLAQTDEGQLFFTDDQGRAGQTSTLTAWDGRLDVFGDPVEVVAIEASLEETGSRGERTDQELTLSTPAELVDDPDVVYPITIDPELTPLTAVQDTWVRLGDTKIDTVSYRVVVGKVGGSSNTNQGLGFMQWPTGALSGRKILAATVHLYQYAAGSCATSKQMNIHPLGGAWDEATTVYSTKPSINAGTGTGSSLTKNVGGEGCSAPNGRVTADLTAMVQGWADGPSSGGFTNYGVQLNVPNAKKTDASYERRFCSINYDPTHTSCKNAARTPYLTVTYNSAPQTAVGPSVGATRTFDGMLWTSDATPALSTSATDAEASRVTYRFEVRTSPTAGNVATCTSATVAAGATAGCDVPTALTDGATYVVRARAVDEHGLAGNWSAWVSFGVDTSAPTTPVITCDGYSNNTWVEARVADSTTCTFTATGVADFEWRRTQAGTVEDQPAVIATAGQGTTRAIPVPATGAVKVEARARSRSGLASAWAIFTFGVGTAAVTQPMLDDRSTSTFPVQAVAAPGATSARVEWRYAPDAEGDTDTGWTTATRLQLKATGGAWTGRLTATSPLSQTPLLTWTPSNESGISVPSTVQLRVVFTYPGAVEMPSPMQRVLLIPHAFGGSYPTQDVAAGSLALFTGEYQVAETDVSVPGTGGNLTFGRTHGTLTGEPAGPAGVFGPGWTADFAGEGAGLAGYVVTDNTALDGTIILTSSDGVSEFYAHSKGTKGNLKTGDYVGIGETALALDELKLASGGGTGISHTLTHTTFDGTITEFQRTTTGVWATSKTVEPEDNSTVTFVRGTDGLPTWVFAPAPDGVTCNATTQAKGCRALKFTYSTVGGGKRLTKVQYRAWDPKPDSDGKPTSSAAMATIDVAGYAYDTQGRLTETWQPESSGDTGTGRRTRYEYTTINSKTVVTQITDPGLVPWRFAYDTQGRLATVKRAHDPAVGTGDATWTIAYDVPLTGPGLPDLTAASVTGWGQLETDAPAGATAVFEPDRTPTGTPGESDWAWASISYFTQAGRTTNTAVYGAGQWLIDSTRYDAHGNTTWTLAAAGRAAALAEPEPASAADKYATLTVYNEAGTRIEATYEPMREVVLDNNQVVVARTLVETVYDDEADPALMPGRPTEDVPEDGFMLPVEEWTSATTKTHPVAAGDTWETRKIRYRYDPVVDGDANGWYLGLPTRTLTQGGDGWVTIMTRHDAAGRIVESRLPAGTELVDTSSDDAYSTKTVYYTADGSAASSVCQSRPEWDGDECLVTTAGDPLSGHPIPTRATTGYSIHGAVTRTDELSSSWERVTVTGYDYVGRVTTSSVSLTDHQTIAGSSVYDPITGLVARTSGNGVTEEYVYDTWGRRRSTTDGTGNTAAIGYDTTGRITTFDDGKGIYVYTYDGTDSLGRDERRGLPTRVDAGLADGDSDVFAGAYDATGSLVHQAMPDGYSAVWTRSITGQATSLTYTQAIEGQALSVLGFSQYYDYIGRVRIAHEPASTRVHSYDGRARLAQVEDITVNGCETRSYAFAGDSNRAGLTTYAPSGDGTCQTTAPASTATYSYDQAGRITNTGYTYDRMGRTLTVPKEHTDQAGEAAASDLIVTYHANDMVASLQQSASVEDTIGPEVMKQAFTLDASDRISQIDYYSDDVKLSESLNHYDSESNSPAWTQTKLRPDVQAAWTTTWNRYVSDLTGGLAIDVDDSGAAILHFANLRGDIVATAMLGHAGITNHAQPDEYGQTPATSAEAAPRRYGWLGSHQRDTNTVGGVVLMGARLYVPAIGRFLSIDPTPWGSSDRYAYPADPVNLRDDSGSAIVLAVPLIYLAYAALVAVAVIKVSDPAYQRAAARKYNDLKEGIRRAIRSIPKPGHQPRYEKKKYRVYLIFFGNGPGLSRVYKYGITFPAGDNRMNVGYRKCIGDRRVSSCGKRYLSKGYVGYHAARVAEYGLYVQHVIRFGYCPIGSPKCK